MKRLLILFVSVLASCCISFATAVTKAVELCYRQSEFSFIHNVLGNLQIIPQSGIYSYDENACNPGLPFFSVAVYVPGDLLYQDCSFTFSKSLLYDSCSLAPAPIPQPTSCVMSADIPRRVSYLNTIYPQDNVRFTGETSMGNSKILYFTVCPFIYDNSDKRLYFTENIKIEITLQKGSNISRPSIGLPTDPGLATLLMHMVINPDDYMSAADSVIASDNIVDKLDYVIITNNDLADSFLSLRNWKRQKGVWTEIMTVEDISQIYAGNSLQEKIKNCLYDLYTRRHLSYVLLGGDDTVVPVRYCRNEAEGHTEAQMPTDMYYSCFGGNFNWDGNGNGIYGEPKDSVGLLPNVYLSRLPIRTADDVRNYTNRLMSYEKMVSPDSWNKKMLFCGCALDTLLMSGRSDAERMGNRLYDLIHRCWNGETKKLCPKKLPDVKVEIENGTLSVKTGIDSCTICVMSSIDNGRSYYKVFHNAEDVCFNNIVDSMSLCVTKQNYIPRVITDVRTYNMLTHPLVGSSVAGTITGVGKIISDDDFMIKYHVANPNSEAKIVVSPYDGSPSKSFAVSANGEMLKLNSRQFRKGVLGISLLVNSKLASSVNYNNE